MYNVSHPKHMTAHLNPHLICTNIHTCTSGSLVTRKLYRKWQKCVLWRWWTCCSYGTVRWCSICRREWLGDVSIMQIYFWTQSPIPIDRFHDYISIFSKVCRILLVTDGHSPQSAINVDKRRKCVHSPEATNHKYLSQDQVWGCIDHHIRPMFTWTNMTEY